MKNRQLFRRDPVESKLLNDGVAAVREAATDKEIETLRYELEHFVCEGQYQDGLVRILESYLGNINSTTQQAAWVSGFYGSGKSHLVRVLEYLWRRSTHDALFCVISDMQGNDPDTRRLATRLANHNDVILCLVFDPLERELPPAGKLVFSEGENQLEVDTSSQKFRERFSSLFEERFDLARKILIQRAVPLIPVSTAEDPVNQLQALLGQARRPGRRP